MSIYHIHLNNSDDFCARIELSNPDAPIELACEWEKAQSSFEWIATDFYTADAEQQLDRAVALLVHHYFPNSFCPYDEDEKIACTCREQIKSIEAIRRAVSASAAQRKPVPIPGAGFFCGVPQKSASHTQPLGLFWAGRHSDREKTKMSKIEKELMKEERAALKAQLRKLVEKHELSEVLAQLAHICADEASVSVPTPRIAAFHQIGRELYAAARTATAERI